MTSNLINGMAVRESQGHHRLRILEQHLVAKARCTHSSLVEQILCANLQGAPVVIGGMVLDIQASPFSHGIRPGTTSPGEVHYVRGGVGRNVAECLARLDEKPFLISIVGDDMAGDSLLAHWCSLGLSVDGIRRCSGASTPVVSAVFDATGELAAAVADTQAIEVYLTPDWIEGFAREIQAAPVILLDGNLHTLALKAACKLANNAGVPVWFEPVSVAKSVRATDLLKSITFVSPNKAEIMAMAKELYFRKKNNASLPQECPIEEDSGSKSVSDILGKELQGPVREVLEAGVKYIVLTLGSQGAVVCSRESCDEMSYQHYPALSASVVKLSGAGDCLVAGTLAALSRNVVAVQAVAYGVAAAKFAVESDMNVPQRFSWAKVADSATTVLSQGRKQVILS